MESATDSVYPHKLRRFYWPFLTFAEACQDVAGSIAGSFNWQDKLYTIPRFIFSHAGPIGQPLRVAIFALTRGDEPILGSLTHQLLHQFVEQPARAAGWEVWFYPLCNPTGYEDGTRHNRAGVDLDREFWRGSSQPEVRILEDELRSTPFDGVVALHSGSGGDSGSENAGPSGRETGAMVEASAEGLLAPMPGLPPRRFGVVLRTPSVLPMTRQAESVCCALTSLLTYYRPH